MLRKRKFKREHPSPRGDNKRLIDKKKFLIENHYAIFN
jgi:hypothetical protein